MLEFKPDYELSKKRIDAFLEHELIDRPVVQFTLTKPQAEQVPLPTLSISNRMFEDVFLPGIVRECQFLDRSIYHLDGPAALRHTAFSCPSAESPRETRPQRFCAYSKSGALGNE